MNRSKTETKKARKARLRDETSQSGSMKRRVDEIAKQVATALEPKTVSSAVAAATVATDAIDADIRDTKRKLTAQVACHAGCNYCCRGVRVDVSVPEVARIVANLGRKLDPVALDGIRARAKANAPQTHGKRVLDYPLRLPCALLGEDGKCVAYAVRPVACRNEHSLNAAECEAGHDTQELGVDSPVSRIPALQMAGSMGVVGTMRGIADVMGESASYELQEALSIALVDPDAVPRWLAGDDAFTSATVCDEELLPAMSLLSRS